MKTTERKVDDLAEGFTFQAGENESAPDDTAEAGFEILRENLVIACTSQESLNFSVRVDAFRNVEVINNLNQFIRRL